MCLIINQMLGGSVLANPASAGRVAGGEERHVRIVLTASVMIALLFAGFGVGRASGTDEIILSVPVTSADHEIVEGYFALGDQGTVVARPGSELFRFLSRQRGQTVRMVLAPAKPRELSRLQR